MKRKAGRCEAREGGHPTVMMEWTPVGTKKRGRTTAENGGHEAPARSSDADMLSMFSSWLCDALRAASNAIDRDHAAVGGGEAQQAARAWRARAIALKKEMTSVERVALHTSGADWLRGYLVSRVHRGGDRTVAKDELRVGLAAIDFLEHQRHAPLAEDASGVDGHGQDFGPLGETSPGWCDSQGGSEAKTIDELGVESGKLGAG